MNLQLATSGWTFCNMEMFSVSPESSYLLTTYSQFREGMGGEGSEKGICTISKLQPGYSHFHEYDQQPQGMNHWDVKLTNTRRLCSSPGSSWGSWRLTVSDRTFIAGTTGACTGPTLHCSLRLCKFSTARIWSLYTEPPQNAGESTSQGGSRLEDARSWGMKDPALSLAQSHSLSAFETDWAWSWLPLLFAWLCAPLLESTPWIPQVPNSQMFISVFKEWCGIFK